MYYNANIHWQPGMELTSDVFMHQQHDFDTRQQLMLRTAMGGVAMGILPMYPWQAEGRFVGNAFEMDHLKLTALLPSGAVISVDDDLRLTLSQKPGPECFVCIGVAAGQVHCFERDGIPYQGPVYELSLHSPADLEEEGGTDVLPLKRLYVEGNTLCVDAAYIPPVVSMDSHEAFSAFTGKYVKLLTDLTAHRNMEEGDCKRTLIHFRFRLQGLTGKEPVAGFMQLLRELDQALDYYIVSRLGGGHGPARDLAADVRRIPHAYDIRAYLTWLDEYLTALLPLMDDVVVENHDIDMEALKREIRVQLTGELQQELYKRLSTEFRDVLVPEMAGTVTDRLRDFVDSHLRPELQAELYGALRDGLYHDIYQALLEALSGLMAKEEQAPEDNFMPLI